MTKAGGIFMLVCVALTSGWHANAQAPDWSETIRPDHPRLFFNADTWPEVRARAEGAEREWYDAQLERVDRLRDEVLGNAEGPVTIEAEDHGQDAARAAFVFLMTEEPEYLHLVETLLDASVRYYELCFEERRSVNWYSTSRAHAVLAWDWTRNHLPEERSDELMARLVRNIHGVMTIRPGIHREHMGSYLTGFYGIRNLEWLIGVAAFDTGIETETVHGWLDSGYTENMRLLEHRREACGDDGGGASPTLGYTLGAYPWSEQNFLYTWLSATGENIAGDWPHAALLGNYVLWNWIAHEDGRPRAFGYGDAPHTSNVMSHSQLYTHMGNIRHLYGRAYPEAAALARHIQENMLPESARRWSGSWFIYPFLMSEVDHPEPYVSAAEGGEFPGEIDGLPVLVPAEESGADEEHALVPLTLPRARFFENMGQTIIRSGDGPGDTYCLFTCGGILRQHRHYDALHLTLYRRGFLALDSGTRYKQAENGQHLANYYAQTVAHNCVLVHQPGEPPANYWGGTVEDPCYGGQHRQLGSEVTAFETDNDFVYVAGDGTASYLHGDEELGEKLERVTRQIVFVPPGLFVVFDRVASTDPSYRKEWLLHTAHRPNLPAEQTTDDGRILGAGGARWFTAAHDEGRMLCRTLLPADAQIELVGGPGREFEAAGRNWEIDTGNLTEEQLALMGQWRVEVSPGAERAEDVFLHVIEVGDAEGPDALPLEFPEDAALGQLPGAAALELIESDGAAGARIVIDGVTWEVSFATTGDIGGHIRRSGGDLPVIDRPLTDEVQPQAGITARPDGP